MGRSFRPGASGLSSGWGYISKSTILSGVEQLGSILSLVCNITQLAIRMDGISITTNMS